MEEYEPGSIRTYLMQMGDIPLLSQGRNCLLPGGSRRHGERFRQGLLSSDYILQAAVAEFRAVLLGRLRIDR